MRKRAARRPASAVSAAAFPEAMKQFFRLPLSDEARTR
jgi:hypothetical protein